MAYLKAASAQNAVSGFKTPGIWPYNPSVFGDEDFVPASIVGHYGNATLLAGQQETTMHEADQTFRYKILAISLNVSLSYNATYAAGVNGESSL